MSSFDRIREQAAALHDGAVAGGANPSNPAALTEAALRQLDLELAVVPAGDVALQGARAFFDDQSGLVCVESGGSPTDRALLIAHELGHASEHGAPSSCSSSDIDATRSIEAAPVGLQRVEDYGARERRELEANVFARELLLPRSRARRLFLDEGQGARAIAEETSLPLDLVRQQILDALLLPTPTPSAPKPGKGTLELDRSQLRAVSHGDAPFQLQAGPGTGKTRTLVARIRSLVSEGADPRAILVVTFSNRAAGELAERIADAVPDAAARVWIGTFHALGLDLVRRYHDRLDLPPDPVLFDRSDAIAVLEEILPTLPLTHYRNLWDPAMELREIVAAISRAKDEMAGPDMYRSLAQEMLRNATDEAARTAAEKCLEVASVYELYERALRDRGAIDFGDLVMRPTLLLKADEKVRTALRMRHRHVLVDEFQDVNRASGRLLRALSGNGRRLWVVGDARQSIYRFRGASSANMPLFSTDYESAVIDRLSVNYRSTSQIVDAFVGVAPRMGASRGMLPLALSAVRGTGSGMPEIRRYETPDDEAAGIAASVRELERNGVALRDQAVLCRSNGRLNEIAEELEARGIPVLHLGSLFEREEVRDLLSLLSIAVDRFADALVRVGAMTRYGISAQDTHTILRRVRELDLKPLAGLRSVSRQSGLPEAVANALRRLEADLEGASSSDSPWEYLTTYLLDRTEIVRDLARGLTARDRMRGIAIWQFLNFARERLPGLGGPPISRLLDRVRQLVLLAEERDLRQVPVGALELNAVRLMTVHGSKGLEFEAVHIPGLTVNGFPTSKRGERCPPPIGLIDGASLDDAEHEEQCLFFVSLSRARSHLRLHLFSKQRNGKRRNASPFLAGC